MTLFSDQRPRVLLLAVVVGLVVTAVGCGGGAAGKAPAALRSTSTQPFEVDTYKSQRYIVGHGVELRMPSSWVTYEPEEPGTLGDTYEWAAGLPADTQPIPAGAQFSMAIPGKAAGYANLPKAARLIAEASPGDAYLASGKVDVPGAKHASCLRFDRDLRIGNQTHKVEQVSLYLDISKGRGSTIRFIAESGDWNHQFRAAYDSVTVAERASS